jgi:Uma2 family endonuclease
MATVPDRVEEDVTYPTSDGRPMAETDLHRDLMLDLIETLKVRYAADPMAYVSGNLLLYYERGNRRRHVSPDVFVVLGVPKRRRDYYLLWEENKGPDVVIELTSSSTRTEDVRTKFALYRDTLRVPEYFLFDPFGDYLKPSMQGNRLHGGEYVAIAPVEGRLPSEVLGLHLERSGEELRLYDPESGQWLPNMEETRAQLKAVREREGAARRRAETGRRRERTARRRAEQELDQERAAREQERAAREAAEAEIARLRAEIESQRRPRRKKS